MALLLKKKKHSRKRKIQTHERLKSRLDKGVHHTLYDDLCVDDTKFFNYFRMSKPSFEELLSLIENEIRGTDTNMRTSIRPNEKLNVSVC